MISRWNCLKQKDKFLVRKFYLRALSQAYKMISLEELCSFFEAILVVALSEYVGCNENGDELPSESRLTYLNTIIKGTPPMLDILNENNEDLDNNDIDDPEEANKQCASDWIQLAINIYDSAKRLADNCTEGTAINACYNPELAKIIKTRLIPYLPLWSGIMRPYFQIDEEIATSSSVKAEFADLKHRAFKGKLPMRADKFVLQHLDYIDGKIKLASCQKSILNTDVEQQNKITHNYSSASSVEMQTEEISFDISTYSNVNNRNITEDIDTDHINEKSTASDTIDSEDQLQCNIYENWRGRFRQSPQEQCSIAKKRRKPSYLDKCPEWDFIKLAKDQHIPLMQNGNTCKSVTINGKVINVSQTCAFDAILHLVASGIASIKCYEDIIKSSENRSINLITSILESGKIIANHYSERAKILMDLPLFSDTLTMYTRTIYKLNTNCNVAHLINYLFPDISSCRATIECSCGYLQTRQTIELCINVDTLLCKGLQYMQEAIDNILAITKCAKCLATVEEKVEYGPHLFIDTTVFTDERYTKRDNKIVHSLGAIATNVQLNSQTYILVGVINYINSSSGNNDS